MLFSIVVIVMFIIISVYFYLRSEKLEKVIIKQKQSSSLASKEHKVLADSLVIIGQKNAEFAKHRLKTITIQAETLEQYSRQAQEKKIMTISPLINNYDAIFQDAVKVKGRVKVMAKECYDGISPSAFQEFSTFMKRSEKHITRNWASNNLSGFIALIEALLLDYEKTMGELILVQKNKEARVENETQESINNKKSA